MIPEGWQIRFPDGWDMLGYFGNIHFFTSLSLKDDLFIHENLEVIEHV